jgi:hypothetical protein
VAVVREPGGRREWNITGLFQVIKATTELGGLWLAVPAANVALVVGRLCG